MVSWEPRNSSTHGKPPSFKNSVRGSTTKPPVIASTNGLQYNTPTAANTSMRTAMTRLFQIDGDSGWARAVARVLH